MTTADWYAAWLPEPLGGFREESFPFPTNPPSELEIQARWFSGEFGSTFFTLTGDTVEIVQFGEWNREAGPDFREAAVSINGAPAVRGCIELDPDVRDWERHGHAVNPAYCNVILHVFFSAGKSDFFTQTAMGGAVPQVRLDLARLDRTSLNPVPAAKLGRCSGPLATMEPCQISGLLAAAAHYRMRRKAQRIAQAVEVHGETEAPYEFIAETLGYKANKLPFRLLAQRFPVGRLRKNRTELEAVLFGASGFLNAADMHDVRLDTKGYLRSLWENWWPRRAEYGNLVLPAKMWKCGGVRPMNHPHRRVGALAELARRWPKAREILRSADPVLIHRFFASLSHEYWDHHYTLTSAASPAPMALVGPERVNAILVNVVLPMALREHPASFEKLQALAAPDFNLRVKTAALRLFATDAKRVPLLRTAINQQGLLQIYDDFCCHDVSGCLNCKLPEQLLQWRPMPVALPSGGVPES
ncbi:MAG: DUF2851 family protein [Verrucomicrobiota bacterium]